MYPSIRLSSSSCAARRPSVRGLQSRRHGGKGGREQVFAQYLGPAHGWHWSRGVVGLQRRRVPSTWTTPSWPLGGCLEGRTRTLPVALLAVAFLGFLLAWEKASLGDRMVWIGAQLSVEVSQWPTQRTSSRPCATRRPSYCQPRSHVRGLSGQSVSSYPVLLAWSPRSGPSLTWSGRCGPLPVAVGARRLSALQGGALVVAGSLLKGPGLPARSVVCPEGGYIATDACPLRFAGGPLTEKGLRKFRACVGTSKHNTAWETLPFLVGERLGPPETRVLVSCLRSRARSDSPANHPTSPRSWPWTPSWLVHSGARKSHH